MRQPNAVSRRRARLWVDALMAEWQRASERQRQYWLDAMPGFTSAPIDAIPLPCESAGRAVERLQNEGQYTAGLDAGAVETLLDLARAGREADFRDLAGCLGVARHRIDGLWSGTIVRIRRSSEEPLTDKPFKAPMIFQYRLDRRG